MKNKRMPLSMRVKALEEARREEQDKAVFEELLGGPLQAMDDRESPVAPPSAYFQGLIEDGHKAAKRKLWRDLLLFWTIGCLLVSAMMLLLVNDLRWFMAVQSGAFVGSLGFLARITLRQVKRRWMS